MGPDCVIRALAPEEVPAALELARRVFLEFEAPDYSEEGVREFCRTLRDEGYLSALRFYGAFLSGRLAGMIAARNGGSHIALFFVDAEYQRRGIGRALLRAVLAQCPSDTLTVNASPYAVPVYRRLGFTETDPEQTVNGLRFTPMERAAEG